ncbi:MAG: ferritin-like domain-containing protein [Bacteroidota bacterium]
MSILKLIDNLDAGQTNTADLNQPTSRREGLFTMGGFGSTVLAAAIPTFLLNMLPKETIADAMAAPQDAVIDVLNFALTLEYLEADFYIKGTGSNSNITSKYRAVFDEIRKHESAHVAVLQQTITKLGGTYVPRSNFTFDFTADGAFPDPFSAGQFGTFLALSQAFEDTGVRAYKGQAGVLMTNNDVLTAALQIHSVEARHAAMVRLIRADQGDILTKPWITGNSRGLMPGATQDVYNGEEKTNQTPTGAYDFNAVTEAYDEPLTMQQTLDIAGLFLD